MIQFSKETDERREAGPQECWCLHGAVGMAADWRGIAKSLAADGIGTRAVDLWRFLECGPMPLADFGKAINADASGSVFRGSGRSLLGYSMGGRMALHALLEENHPWQSAVIISAHPGLENDATKVARRSSDAEWATRSLAGNWQQFLTGWDSQPILSGASLRDPSSSGQLAARRREIARSFVDWSLGTQESLWERLGEITIPVLWVVGENDPKFQEIARRATELMPSAELVVAPSAGHRVPWEAPQWFSSQVSRFLKLGRV